MTIPSVNFTFPENGLGNLPSSPDTIFAVIGASSAGTVETPASVGGSAQNVVDAYGYGPAPDLAGNLISSGATVIFVRADSTPQAPGSL